jgi:chitodextrinase
MKHSFSRQCAAAAIALMAAGCTMKQQEAPAVSGPSEFGTALVITVTPDILQQDGSSQSVVTITARGPNGNPQANVPLRAEILVGGQPVDFGSLSARQLVTAGDGRATLVYTAPLGPAGVTVDSFTIVDIAVTPIGGNFANSSTRFASLRLVPVGTIAPPAGLRPAFTFSPAAPIDNQDVLFDASTSQAPANNPIVEYRWSFGDGETDRGVTAVHDYGDPGTYVVTLTVVDALGRTASSSQSLTVAPGVNPTALFTSSPTAPVVGQVVNFNARGSAAAPGRTIVKYVWDFGDGTSGSGAQASHTYGRAGTYVVTLVVTDDVGKTATVTGQVAIAP